MTRRYVTAIAMLAVMLLPSLGSAQGLGYNHVEAGIARIDPDSGPNADGAFIQGSWLVTRNLFLTAGFSDIDTDYLPNSSVWAEYETMSVGAGYRVGLAEATDWVTNVAYLRAKAGLRYYWGRLSSDSDNGFGISTGIRHLFSERLELAAGVSYSDVLNADETAFDASVVYHFNPTFGVLGGFSYSDDGRSLSAGVRLKF